MDWTPRERLAKRLRRIQREIEANEQGDAARDEVLKAITIEGFDTLEGYARFEVAQNARIFEAVMQLNENSGTPEQLAALTERLKVAHVKLADATD